MSMQGLDFGLATYQDKYRHIRFDRRDGILEVRVHTDGDSLMWCDLAHDELGHCFTDIANDADNKVVILTGEGDCFCTEPDVSSFGEATPRNGQRMHLAGLKLVENLLNIPVPVIGAVNGAAHIHAELPLLSNVVIASDDASFQDKVHFPMGIVPGDGVHVAWPALLGHTRGSYFLLMGEVMDVETARNFGIVHEIVPRAELMSRAWQVAAELAAKPIMVSRYSRMLLTHELKRLMHSHLSLGLATECLAMLDQEAD